MLRSCFRFSGADLALHFEEDLFHIEKFRPQQPVSAVYFDGETKEHMVKRFIPEMSDRKTLFIAEAEGSLLLFASTDTYPRIQLEFAKMGKVDRAAQEIELEPFIAVKGLKAKGKKLAAHPPKKILVLESLPEPEPAPEPAAEQGGADATQGDGTQSQIVADLDADDPQMSLFREEE